MKFKLKTLFALTAVVAFLLMLVRLNPWLPIFIAALFGPATLAVLLAPRWVVQAGCLSIVLVAPFLLPKVNPPEPWLSPWFRHNPGPWVTLAILATPFLYGWLAGKIVGREM